MKDWNDATKWTEDDWKDLIARPEPPDDPDENSPFEEWVIFENGERQTIIRPNPNYKPDNQPQ